MIIYSITNTINNKRYIGQTEKSIFHRWSQHKHYAIKKQIDTKFYRAIRKYGTNCWSLETLEIPPTKEMMNEREIYHISFFNSFHNGYNSTSGGFSQVLSQETIEKIRTTLTGRKRTSAVTPEERQKKSEGKLGNKNPMFGNPNASRHLHDKSFKCKYCNITTTKGNITRWHNEKCNRTYYQSLTKKSRNYLTRCCDVPRLRID